ncbi:hypothetical protein NC651_005383 [Populus alba x Populus x berolinensis]|nr:hypothetical protein NC651_005383 [Populus alba x Populus x berolinensis]
MLQYIPKKRCWWHLICNTSALTFTSKPLAGPFQP